MIVVMTHALLVVLAMLVSLAVFLASKWYCSLMLSLPLCPQGQGHLQFV
jgi:hypothetical protein